MFTLLGTQHTGVTITGIQSGVSIFIGGSVTITCTTDSPADSIMLLQDNQPLHGTHQSSTTILMYTIPLVTDSINGNIFKCEAKLTGRTYSSNTASDMVTIFIKSKSIIVLWILLNTTPQFPNNLSMLASEHPAHHNVH